MGDGDQFRHRGLQVVQENKQVYNKSYRQGYDTGFEDKNFRPPAGNEVIVPINVAQGLVPYVFVPLTFLGAKKMATAKNWQEFLLGVAGASAGASFIILNSAYNFANSYADVFGNYAGKSDALWKKLNHAFYGVKNIYLPEVPTGYNGIGVASMAVLCGFFSGVTKRLQSNMQQQPTAADPTSVRGSLNNV